MLRRPGPIAALAVVVTGLLGACSGSGSSADAPATSVPTVPITAPATTTTTTTAPDTTAPTSSDDGDFASDRDPFAPQG